MGDNQIGTEEIMSHSWRGDESGAFAQASEIFSQLLTELANTKAALAEALEKAAALVEERSPAGACIKTEWDEAAAEIRALARQSTPQDAAAQPGQEQGETR